MTDFTKDARKMIRQEGSIGQRLDSHRHIIKLVGTFWEAGHDRNRCTFNILTFPVAVCYLEQMLEDCEEFSAPKRTTPLDRNAALERLKALDFHTNRTSQEIRTEMRLRLQEIMGCLTEGILWMHSEKCQHRDIKPANILVRPGRVLITDFGIARDRKLVQNTTTELSVGGTMGYMAPEVLNWEANNPEHTDIYALGCVFLRILNVIHGPNQELKMIEEQPHPHQDRFRERQFKEFIAKKGAESPHQILPLQYQSLIAGMLDDDRHQRPAAMHVNASLLTWAIADGEKFHGPCCQTPQDNVYPPSAKSLPIPILEEVTRSLSNAALDNSVLKAFIGQAGAPESVPFAPPHTQPFTHPLEKKWYRIINQIGNVKRALQADSKWSIAVAAPADHETQYWQFEIADKNKLPERKPLSMGGMLYWINNKTFKPEFPLSLKPNNFAELCIGDDKQGRGSNVVWYFGVGQGKGGPAVMLLRNEQLNYWWGMGYNGNQAVMKNAEALDTFWYLEEADVPYLESSYPRVSSTMWTTLEDIEMSRSSALEELRKSGEQ